jgi:hypothetical protein
MQEIVRISLTNFHLSLCPLCLCGENPKYPPNPPLKGGLFKGHGNAVSLRSSRLFSYPRYPRSQAEPGNALLEALPRVRKTSIQNSYSLIK